jgi:tRNA threonylcarbamoyladenosine dehydratase
MKLASIMIALQSISLVTPFMHYQKPSTLNTVSSCVPISNGISTLPEIMVIEYDYRERFTNVARLYENNVNITLLSLRNAHVCVVGLGGVGSWCVEALARSGISRFTLIDMDDICISNTNRQIQALTSTVGQFKADALRNRILDINPYATVEVLLDFLRPTNVDSIVAGNIILPLGGVPDQAENIGSDIKTSEDDDEINATLDLSSDQDVPYFLSGPSKFDFLVDAADGVTDKAFMIDACVRSGTPVVVCGGAGGLTDPTLLRIRCNELFCCVNIRPVY